MDRLQAGSRYCLVFTTVSTLLNVAVLSRRFSCNITCMTASLLRPELRDVDKCSRAMTELF